MLFIVEDGDNEHPFDRVTDGRIGYTKNVTDIGISFLEQKSLLVENYD